MTTPLPDPGIPEAPLPPPDPSDPLATAQWLGAGMIRLTQELKDTRESSERRDETLTKYGRGNRHRIWVSYVLIFFDVALTVALVVFAAKASSADGTANQTRQTLTASCGTGNQLRQALNQVFDYVFDGVQPPANATPAEKAQEALKLKALEAYYHAKFASRNCSAVPGVTPAVTLIPQRKETAGAKR